METETKRTPKAVLISDIHYSLATLEVADACLRQAIEMANDLEVPLIIAGDLHDTKAAIRAECANAIATTLHEARNAVLILRGNHDSLNEKSREHALQFMHKNGPAFIIHGPTKSNILGLYLVPYYHDVEALREFLATLPDGATLIMHQGLQEANAGEYFQDKSALNKDDVHRFRVISGHYHRRQDIKVGRPRKGAVGLWSYIGNPYSLNFGEADDPEKGFQVLYDDGLLEFVPTNKPRHIRVGYDWSLESQPVQGWQQHDILAVKVINAPANLTKEKVAKRLHIEQPFRLDLIPAQVKAEAQENVPQRPQREVLDSMVDTLSNVDDETKARIKALWRKLDANS